MSGQVIMLQPFDPHAAPSGAPTHVFVRGKWRRLCYCKVAPIRKGFFKDRCARCGGHPTKPER